MRVTYILTRFSPAMFGEGATAHIKFIDARTPMSLIDRNSQIVTTRVSDDQLARNQLPGTADETTGCMFSSRETR